MSENKPEPKDRTALYIAIVGATATIIAAFIAVLPSLLNRGPAPVPTPIVIIATPVPLTPVPPTTTIVAPIATAVPPSLTPAGRIDFLVTNNRPSPLDFFVDDEYQVTVPPGGYQILRVVAGEHRLGHCPQGAKPSDPNSGCETLLREVRNEPYDWQLGGSSPARDKVLLFLLNQIDRDLDIYVNDTEMVSVNAHKIGTLPLTPGTHRLQACPRGTTPAQGSCGTVGEFEFRYNVEMYVVNIP